VTTTIGVVGATARYALDRCQAFCVGQAQVEEHAVGTLRLKIAQRRVTERSSALR